MNCPICGECMREIVKYSVEIDICPGCKGVWLDRGELEKIIDMASAGNPLVEGASPAPAPTGAPDGCNAPVGVHGNRPVEPVAHPYRENDDRDDHHHRDHDDHRGYGHDHGYGQRRREGWFSELFDD